TCVGQKYGTILQFPAPIDVQSVDFNWLPQSDGVIQLSKVVFIEKESAKADPVREADLWVGDSSRWRAFDDSGGVAVYENLRAMPRAWLVPETLSLSADDVKRSIKTSRLPDGRAYHPATVALLEDPLGFRSAAFAQEAGA